MSRDNETNPFPRTTGSQGQQEFPWAVIHGPITYQGLNIPNLYVKQLITHILTLLQYGPQVADPTGTLI